MFIDYAKIRVDGGRGGNGCRSFRREKHVPHGGPDGGCGGDGGDVIALADPDINTLIRYNYKKHFEGGDGKAGQGSNKYGKSGDDVFIKFPLGTVIYEIDEAGNRIQKIADISDENDKAVLAKGGKGGRGNAVFTSTTNQAPTRFEKGEKGEVKHLEVVLKLMADAGLVGFPNAGKSTLISHLSAAHPKVASYQFTTLQPCIGVVRVDEIHSFVMADIPGIIEGAHNGKGLGIQFLKHIERNKVLLYVMDITQPQLDEKFQTLKNELASYKKSLVNRESLIVLNKIDLIPKGDLDKYVKVVKENLQDKNIKIIPVSAATGKNLDKLKYEVYHIIKKLK
ncbi:MAG: GTPase ObgE [Candidatus Cloacimonetes bacterium]|nr:GTPase ObgE [Candidatus Cloacimonadota bacterium]MBS3767413.1 GTPase ObgE [Candidatus Cloacimonadota bacterium]